ncbi:hypothetical protein Patl1_25210 [Pistacia atlantica]|uniref:Uncharacterized protein n=1 Tax=Pistacia atlantica TaxID=434234 RepID=A0ACC1B0K5_9ROSI|nr:hypothetical protein Patl1_25210 [Pistacia atlantica]
MASKISFLSFVFVFTILFASSGIQFGAAMRPLHENPLLKKYFPGLALSLTGPVPPIHGSPCTHIPGGSGKCHSTHTVNEMNFAGQAVRAPPAFSGNFIDSSVAS